jgi:S1-C subfamily serine protease
MTPRRRVIRTWQLLFLMPLAFPAACSSEPETRREEPPIPPGLLEDERNTIEIFRKASRSVVFITTKELQRVSLFSASVEVVPTGSGSGFVWDTEGHIVTNNHVVAAQTQNPTFSVTLADGSTYDAELVGAEPEKDLAVLKIDASRGSLVPIEPGDSDALVVGQKVLAIGNPFGLDHTLTTGIISALGREMQTDRGTTIRDVIQTDASINPGNSGGPLLDSLGRLIGINTAIQSPTGSSVGIGFAVPVASVKRVVPQIIRYGRVQRPVLGVIPIPDSRAWSVGIRGVVIYQVRPGSAAERAGMQSLIVDGAGREHYDTIVEIDGHKIEGYGDLYDVLDQHKAGDRVKVRFVRDGRPREVEVVLKEIE